MVYYYQEILKELITIPTPNCPGTIIVTGESQAIIASQCGDVIIAACQYGPGRILTFAHDCYLDWIFNPSGRNQEQFSRNVMKWMTGDKVLKTNEFIDINGNLALLGDLSKFKVIRWNHLASIEGAYDAYLIDYLMNGGVLVCASTPWGYLQLRPGENLKDMQQYKFLKIFGMLYTDKCISLPDELKVSEIQSPELSNFDNALSMIHLDCDFGKCVNTVAEGYQILEEENMLSEEKMSQFQSNIQQKMLINPTQYIPTKTSPVFDPFKKHQMNIMGKCLNYSSQFKAPGIDQFPGDFQTRPDLLTNINLKLKSAFTMERLSTGYYLPAGVQCRIQFNYSGSSDINDWSVRIGAHSDDLSHVGEGITRWPIVTIVRKLKPCLSVCSAYGGLVYFENSKKNSRLDVTLSNVVASPYFDLTSPETLENWEQNRNTIGLWGELAGEHIIFTAPSECMRHIADPRGVLQFWDKVVCAHHLLRGTDARDQKRERVVNDQQPSCGYMHSGYPIVTHLDCSEPGHEFCIFDLEKLSKKGNWGLFHELGHNLQRNEWTFDGSVEVTVNFFSMHAYHILLEKDVTEMKWLCDQQKQISEYLSRTDHPTYNDWQSNYGLGLYTFAVLIKKFGWKAMYTFLHQYEFDIRNNAINLPHTNQEKLDQWVLRYSKITGCNIKPYFERLGLPVSSCTSKDLQNFKPFTYSHNCDTQAFFQQNRNQGKTSSIINKISNFFQ